MNEFTQSVLDTAIDATTELGEAVLDEALDATADLAAAALGRRVSLIRVILFVAVAGAIAGAVWAYLQRRSATSQEAAEQ